MKRYTVHPDIKSGRVIKDNMRAAGSSYILYANQELDAHAAANAMNKERLSLIDKKLDAFQREQMLTDEEMNELLVAWVNRFEYKNKPLHA